MKCQAVGKSFGFGAALNILGIAALLLSIGSVSHPAAAAAGMALLAPPDGLVVQETDSTVTLTWNAVYGASAFNVYRSLTEGLGYSLLTTVPANMFQPTYAITDANLVNQTTYYYLVTTVDPNGAESGYSNEIAAMPHLVIDWVGTITPEFIDSYTLGSADPVTITGKVHIPHRTGPDGPAPGMMGQLGYGPAGTAPETWTHWFDAKLNGTPIDETPWENDYYIASFRPEAPGSYETIYRFSTTLGRDWVYGGFALIDPTQPAGSGVRIGKLHVIQGSDSTPPGAPGSPSLVSASTTSITLAWGGATDNAALYRYDILRGANPGGPYTLAGSVDAAGSLMYQDTGLVAGTTYYYVVQAVDTSFNRSGYSSQLAATTVPSMVSVTIQVSIPAFTPGDVYINQAVNPDGSLGGQSWTAIKMSADVTPNTFTTTLNLREGTHFAFHFSRGSPSTVQTNADGNLAAPVPDFTVTSGMAPVRRMVFNWDDPLVVAHWPDVPEAEMRSPVTITWNQAMPGTTRFAISEIVSGIPVNFPGTFITNPATRTTRFQPVGSFTAGHSYAVSVSGQPDINGLAQMTPLNFTFRALQYHAYIPGVRR